MISQATFQFLKDLTANNNREWFSANKKRYEKGLQEAKSLAAAWIEGMAAFNEDVADNEASKAVFRIYRDTRFSPDKTPYKNHMGMAIGKGGRTSRWAGYYLHISPGESFIAGGKWMPESPELKKIRQEIDYNHAQLQEIVGDVDFQALFGDLDRELTLKKNPKDYPADHPAIEWLKLKSFTVTHMFSDEEVLSPEFAGKVIHCSKVMTPFIHFINTALDDVEG